MVGAIFQLLSCICIAFLVFTELDGTQRLLLAGVVLFAVVADWRRDKKP